MQTVCFFYLQHPIPPFVVSNENSIHLIILSENQGRKKRKKRQLLQSLPYFFNSFQSISLSFLLDQSKLRLSYLSYLPTYFHTCSIGNFPLQTDSNDNYVLTVSFYFQDLLRFNHLICSIGFYLLCLQKSFTSCRDSTSIV